MDIRELSAIERTLVWLEELLPMCKRLGSLYGKNSQLAADVSRKAKALRTCLHKLKEFLDAPQ